MKKLFFTLLALMTFVGGAWAQNLDRTGWTILASSACNDSGSGHVNALTDGNTGTFWHSNWGGGNSYGANNGGCPHAIQIDLASEQDFFGITVQNRTDGLGNGRTKDYAVYVSNTPFTESTTGFSPAEVIVGHEAVLTGTFQDGQGRLNQAGGTTKMTGRYVLFVVNSSYNQNGNYACISEINLLAKPESANNLYTAIEAAKALTTGTGFGTFDATKLTAAISAAQNVYDNASSADEFIQALSTLNAAVIDADNTPGNYTLKNKERSGNVYLGYSDKLCGTSATAAGADAIKFETTTTPAQYILSIGDKYFTDCTKSAQVGVTTTKSSAQSYIVAKNSDGSFGIQSTGGGQYQWFHMDSGMKLVGWERTSGASKWDIEEIKEYVTVTYNIMDGETLVKSLPVQAEVGAAFPTPTINPWVTITGVPTRNVTGAETISVGYTSSVKTFANVAAVNQWYTMDVHGNESNYQVLNDADAVVVTNRGAETGYQSGNTRAEQAWAFIGNPFDGVKVYNNAAQKYLKQPSNDDVQIVFDAEGDLFQVMATTSGLANSFALKVEGRTYYINHRGTKLQGWTAADAGSSFRVWAVDGIEAGPDWDAFETLLNKINAMNFGDGLGQYANLEVPNYSAHITDFISFFNQDFEGQDKDQYADDMEVMQWIIANKQINLPQVGMFVTIKGKVSGKYIHNDGTTGANITLGVGEDVTNIFYVADGKKLLNYSNGLYMTGGTQSAVGGASDTYTFSEGSAAGNYYIKPSSKNYLIDWTDGKSNYWSNPATSNGRCNWEIEEIESLPVTIGDALYATFYAPVGVQVPQGVTAYVLEEDGNYLTATAVEGVIPASTGVILKADAAGTYNFDIATANDVAESCLSGTVATVAAPQNTYTLAKGNNGIGFYGFDGQSVKGFKAFYENESNEVRSFAIDFGGETGIKSVSLEDNESTSKIYNLAGQRVQKMQKGIYIINGKKVLK